MASRLDDKLNKPAAKGAGDGAPAADGKVLCLDIDAESSFGFELVTATAGTLVWPMFHLMVAKLNATGTELKVTWASHELTVRGRNLGLIARALRRGQSAIVREIDRKYSDLYKGEDVFVHELEIEERSDDRSVAALPGGDEPAELP